jgi:hypothetical protein
MGAAGLFGWILMALACLPTRHWWPGLIAAFALAFWNVRHALAVYAELGVDAQPAALATRAAMPFLLFVLLRGARWLALRFKARGEER